MSQNFADIENFTQFFRRKIEPKLHSFEKQRKRTLLLCNITLVIGVILQLFFLFAFFTSSNANSNSIELLFAPAVITGVIHTFIKKKYTKKVKAKIFNAIFSFLGDFTYIEKNEYIVDRSKYEQIPMIGKFNREPDIDDYIRGTYKNLPIEIEELYLKYVYHSNKHHHERTVFDGLLVTVPQLKTTNATIITANRKFHDIEQLKDEVKLEDVEYQKIYKTSSDNQIEARYILTPKLMEKLKSLNSKGITTALCFIRGDIYIGIKTGKDMFEPSITKPATDISSYKDIINQLKETLQIIDILQLEKKAIL